MTLDELVDDVARREHESYIEECAMTSDRDEHPRAVIITPSHFVSRAMLRGWRDEAEKVKQIRLLRIQCRAFKAVACVITCGVRWMDLDAFVTYYKLPYEMPILGSGKLDDAKRDYFRILREHGGNLGNLPSELWTERIFTVARGPSFAPRALTTTYRQNRMNGVDFEKTQRLDQSDTAGFLEMNVLPEWWDVAKERTIHAQQR
jgi:hypothetical protein